MTFVTSGDWMGEGAGGDRGGIHRGKVLVLSVYYKQ